MYPVFNVGDRVVRIKGNYIGERATVVRLGVTSYHISFDNKNICGDRTYQSGIYFIKLIDPNDDLDID